MDEDIPKLNVRKMVTFLVLTGIYAVATYFSVTQVTSAYMLQMAANIVYYALVIVAINTGRDLDFIHAMIFFVSQSIILAILWLSGVMSESSEEQMFNHVVLFAIITIPSFIAYCIIRAICNRLLKPKITVP